MGTHELRVERRFFLATIGGNEQHEITGSYVGMFFAEWSQPDQQKQPSRHVPIVSLKRSKGHVGTLVFWVHGKLSTILPASDVAPRYLSTINHRVDVPS